MFITLHANKGKQYHSPSELIYSSPYHYIGPSAETLLLYTRLPVGCSAEEAATAMETNDFDFIWEKEGNFTLLFVMLEDSSLIVKSLTDRYGSRRVYHRETNADYIISTDWRAVIDEKTPLSKVGLADIIASRILSDGAALFEGVQVTPLQHAGIFQKTLSFKSIPCPVEHQAVISGSQEDKINAVKAGIVKPLKAAAKTYEKCAVLLSGGVDSFNLAALAKEVFNEVILYTPTWEEDFNPELERAKVFAAELGLEHHIITLTMEDIETSYFKLIEQLGIPLRNFSSIALFSLFNHIKEEAILYGEFADTLFGSGPTKGYILDLKYIELLKPLCILPAINRKKQELSESENLYKIINIYKDPAIFIERAGIFYFADKDAMRVPYKKSAKNTDIWKTFNIQTDCRQHLIEIEAAAAEFNKVVITPYYNKTLLNLSNQLPPEDIYGPKGLSIRKNFKQAYVQDVKLLLKLLACRYIASKHIFLVKLGFPTPHARWIHELFKSDIAVMHSQNLIDGTSLAHIQENYEWIWTQLNLFHVTNQITKMS